MRKPRTLTKRQLAVIKGLFVGELDEPAVLDKHGVSSALYDRWFTDERFTEQFNKRLARAYRQSHVILARSAPLAAVKLVELTQCKEEEMVRRACLDIISLHTPAGQGTPTQSPPAEGHVAEPELSPERASRLLAALAEELSGEDITAGRSCSERPETTRAGGPQAPDRRRRADGS